MGKQDMCKKFAQEYIEAFQETTEDQAREMWDADVFELLGTLRTKLTESLADLFPLRCPKCQSYKITVVYGTDRNLKCLSYRSEYSIVDSE